MYTWPDLSPVKRQYVVVDNTGRYGIAIADIIHHEGVLFAHPVEVPATIHNADAICMTDTAWHIQPDGSYTGRWYDDHKVGIIPPEDMRRINIVSDLGYVLPDQWAAQALAGSDQRGHWDYGATLGKVGGQPPVKGQAHNEMTVAQAEQFATEAGEKATARTIRQAAEHSYIPGARKIGRDWLIPYEGFNHYLDNRPKPGRK